MAKAPSFPFYVKDWLTDPELQACSASTRGIWINALCFMWQASQRGIISGSHDALARLLNCTPEEFALFLEGASVTEFANVTVSNSNVTIENRRMVREEKARKTTRLRVQKHRRNAPGNADVTPPFPFPSPSAVQSLSKDKPPEGGPSSNHWKEKVGAFFESIHSSCKTIAGYPPPAKADSKKYNPFQHVQMLTNAKQHPGAIDEMMQQLAKPNTWMRIEKSPMAYGTTIMARINGNWNEKDAIAIHEELKRMPAPELRELTRGMFESI
jgi:hypothetical protein